MDIPGHKPLSMLQASLQLTAFSAPAVAGCAPGPSGPTLRAPRCGLTGCEAASVSCPLNICSREHEMLITLTTSTYRMQHHG